MPGLHGLHDAGPAVPEAKKGAEDAYVPAAHCVHDSVEPEPDAQNPSAQVQVLAFQPETELVGQAVETPLRGQ